MLSLDKDSWSGSTEPCMNAGRNAAWENIGDIEVPVTGDMLRYKRMLATVYDKRKSNSISNSGDSFMGSGDFSLRKLGSQSITSSSQIVATTYLVKLKDKRGKHAGRLTIKIALLPLPDPTTVANKEESSNNNNQQLVGRIQIAQCSASKLPNTAVFTGKQDLFMKICIADWKYVSSG